METLQKVSNLLHYTVYISKLEDVHHEHSFANVYYVLEMHLCTPLPYILLDALFCSAVSTNFQTKSLVLKDVQNWGRSTSDRKV
jgi:hypothetical protein